MRRGLHDYDPTAVYRLYGDFDVLLYVGISKYPDERLNQHFDTQPWAFLIRSRSIEWRDTRREALDLERAAIEADAPLFNKALALHDYQRWHGALVWMWNSGWGLTPWRLPALARVVAVEPQFWEFMVRLFSLAEYGPGVCGDCLWEQTYKTKVRAMFGYDAENEAARDSRIYELAVAVIGAALPDCACDLHGRAETGCDECDDEWDVA